MSSAGVTDIDVKVGLAVDVPTIMAALAALDSIDPDSATRLSTAPVDAEEPIFVLAVGWRTGSTLLQRILVTDRRLLLWGEPMGAMGLIPRITEALCLASSKRWPHPGFWIQEETGKDQELAASWIANLYPPAHDLRASFQEWIIRWLGVPARARGYTRWGFKEVRLGASEACFLRWVFPRAKFLALIRNPYDAYLSVRAAQGSRPWFDPRVHNAADFARHWNRLALSWLQVPQDFGHILIKYEDLIASRVDFVDIERALGLRLDVAKALALRITGRRGDLPPEGLTEADRRTIARESGRGMEAFGYNP